MAWADKLPQMVANREAWQAEHGPRIRERDERVRKERSRATVITANALKVVHVSDEDREMIARITGLVL